MIRHVSFDFDGVLAQGSNEAYFENYHRALLHVGVTLDRELERQRIYARWGQSVKEQIELLLEEHPDKVAKAVEFYDQTRRDPSFLTNASLYAGAEQTLRALHGEYTLSIISGSYRPFIESVLGPNLTPFFSCIYSTSDYKPELQKPSPHILKQAMQDVGIAPQETVYVGDAPNDLRMAVAANVGAIAMLTGHLTRLSAAELGARAILEDISELPDAIRSL